MTPVPETPAKKQNCHVPECKKAPKGFKTSQGLKGHMKKFHEIVIDALSPVTASARVLFAPETPSAQGNSKGQHNLPSVMTEGRYQCGQCTEQFKTKEEVKSHMDDKHDKVFLYETIDEPVINDKGDTQVESDNALRAAENDIVENDEEVEQDLVNIVEDLELEGIAREVKNLVRVDKIVDSFVDSAFEAMNPGVINLKPGCEECHSKDEKNKEYEKAILGKDARLAEKTNTIRGLMETLKNNKKEKVEMTKKLNKTEELRKKNADLEKDVSDLKEDLHTSEALLKMARNENITPPEVQVPEMSSSRPEVRVPEKDMLVKIKCRECDFQCENREELLEHKRQEKAKSRAKDPAYANENNTTEEGPLSEEDSKCGQCSYTNKNRVLLREHEEEMHRTEGGLVCEEDDSKCGQCNYRNKNKNLLGKHKEERHKEIKCVRCGEISAGMASFRQHGEKKHNYPTLPKCNSFYKWTPCQLTFKSHEDMMEHLSQIHLTESQRNGHGLAKYQGSGYENRSTSRKGPEPCRNGNQCRFHRQSRCHFYHEFPPMKQQARHPRQSPTDQWQEVPSRGQNGNNVRQSHVQQPQGHRYWSVPPQSSLPAPWCLHGTRCPVGSYCVLRHEDQDFPNLQQQDHQ